MFRTLWYQRNVKRQPKDATVAFQRGSQGALHKAAGIVSAVSSLPKLTVTPTPGVFPGQERQANCMGFFSETKSVRLLRLEAPGASAPQELLGQT